MERIQEAIAKAREMREAQLKAARPEPETVSAPGPQPEQAPLSRPAPSPEPEDSPSEANSRWEDIPEFRPTVRVLRRHRIMTSNGGRQAVEFDGIRTKLLQLQRTHGWKRIAVTSPNPGCGKSTLVMNLAFSLSRQRELRTIVMEMDLRRPSIARMIGLREKQSIADVLARREPFEHNAVRIGNNMLVSTNVGGVSNPSELLHSNGTAEVLDEIAQRYCPDVMLFDLPPMLAVDDAMAFFARVDAVILVAAAEQTTIKQIDVCEREIASQTNMMGVVLNKCRYMDREQSYGYGGY